VRAGGDIRYRDRDNRAEAAWHQARFVKTRLRLYKEVAQRVHRDVGVWEKSKGYKKLNLK
jgi:hypothetical protein